MQVAVMVSQAWSSVSGGQVLRANLQRSSGLLTQLSRYGVVSAAALGVDFSTYLTLCAMAIKPAVAGIVGYSSGLVLSYALSTRFVFDTAGCQKSEARLFGEFLISGLVGVVLTWLVIALATEGFDLSAIAAKAMATVASFFTIFAIRRVMIFAS